MRKRLALFLIFLLVAVALDALGAPFVVAHGMRLWISWAAKKQGLTATIGKVEAPFLRPVTIRQLQLAPAPGRNAQEVKLQANNVVGDLNLSGWLRGPETARLLSVGGDRGAGSCRTTRAPVRFT